MICNKCGKNNPVGTQFCSGCGEEMPATVHCGGFADILSYSPESDEMVSRPMRTTIDSEGEVSMSRTGSASNRDRKSVMISLVAVIISVVLCFCFVFCAAKIGTLTKEVESVQKQIRQIRKDAAKSSQTSENANTHKEDTPAPGENHSVVYPNEKISGSASVMGSEIRDIIDSIESGIENAEG